jgi:hypothetical protein
MHDLCKERLLQLAVASVCMYSRFHARIYIHMHYCRSLADRSIYLAACNLCCCCVHLNLSGSEGEVNALTECFGQGLIMEDVRLVGTKSIDLGSCWVYVWQTIEIQSIIYR